MGQPAGGPWKLRGLCSRMRERECGAAIYQRGGTTLAGAATGQQRDGSVEVAQQCLVQRRVPFLRVAPQAVKEDRLCESGRPLQHVTRGAWRVASGVW